MSASAPEGRFPRSGGPFMNPARTVLCAVASLSLVTAASSFAQAPLPSHGGTTPAATDPKAAGGVAGITWTKPADWTDGKGSAMRVATYVVPGAKGGEDGQCAVFYFGPGQGGGIDDNITRWERQFKEQPTAKRDRRTVSGLVVHQVSIEGTYMNPGGGMMQSRGEKPGYRLLGAIVEAPEGHVFFKLTGPAATAQAGQAGFDSLLGSLTRE